MTKRIRFIALMTAAGALLVAPAAGQAHPRDGSDQRPTGDRRPAGDQRPSGQSRGGERRRERRCVVRKGFVVKGTLVSYTPDNPDTADDEQAVTLTVTRMNRHARRAGVADSDPATEGTQYELVAGGADGDPFRSRLSGYEPGESPKAGDKVRVIGKVAVTRRRCAPDASVEDRYGEVNVRKVKIIDVD